MRTIFDLPPEIRMAIKLRAVKNGCTTGEVVECALREILPQEVEEAMVAMRQEEQP